MRRITTHALSILLVSLLGACGGGGANGGADDGEGGDERTPSAPQLLGPYGYLEFFARAQGGMFTEAGPAEIDATGTLTGDGRRYFTSLASAEALSTTNFVLDPIDGALSNFDSGGGLLRLGGLGEGNHLALLAAGDNLANVLVLTRPSTGAQTSALEGAYHFTLLSPSEGFSLWGKIEFDNQGVGVLAAAPIGNENNTLFVEEIFGVSAQLQTTGSAAVSFEPPATSPLQFEGTVSDGAGLIVSSRVDSDDGAAPMALAMVRAPTEGNNALFQGKYWIVFFAAQEAPGSGGLFGSVRGVIDADGQGSFSISATVHTGASFSVLESPGVYSVGPDGTLSLDLTFASGSWTGGIDAFGRHAVLGGDSEGRTPTLGLLVRQP